MDVHAPLVVAPQRRADQKIVPAVAVYVTGCQTGAKVLAVLLAQELGSVDQLLLTAPGEHEDEHLAEHVGASRRARRVKPLASFVVESRRY